VEKRVLIMWRPGDENARKAGKNIKRVNKKALELLQSYPWPGNIPE
jgi:transcriptional regulator with PAS, ATPase and Fis domain